eukprot:TRINITY_DN10384_c0_g1_i2.p2 TRINITY_DN10384_c0_g1~~TRINITY_DN10384_c0_g1_i2.p2  ORF type:complete len:240 (+),score=73.60 TRINITY_DN10384_c0_g1_i2:2474-3193(+)
MFQDDEDDDILEASRSAKEVNPFSFQNFLADESEPTAEPTVEPAEQDAESNPFSFKTFVNDKKPSVVVSGASSDSDSSSIDSDEDLDQNGEQNGAPVAQRLSSKVLDGSMKKPPATVAGRIRAKVQQLETQLAASQEENQQLKSRYKTTLTKLKRDNKDLQQQLQEVRAKNNQLQKALDLKTTREQDETKQLEQVASQVEKNLAKAIVSITTMIASRSGAGAYIVAVCVRLGAGKGQRG